MSRLATLAMLIATALVALPCPDTTAIASRPVPRTLQGCVINGVFITHDGYPIRTRNARHQPFDLRAYEGMEIRYSGALLPGDVFYGKGRPIILGPCRKRPITR